MWEGLSPCTSFVLCSWTVHTHELRNRTVSICSLYAYENTTFCIFTDFVQGQPQKLPAKTYNKEICQAS